MTEEKEQKKRMLDKREIFKCAGLVTNTEGCYGEIEREKEKLKMTEEKEKE